MSRKRLKKKNSDILRLKILLEDKEIAEEELDIGINDLRQILQEYSKIIESNQKNKYNNFFFGTQCSDNEKVEFDNNLPEIVVSTSTVERKNIKRDDTRDVIPWVKKLYKKIVQRSHPDKYVDFPIDEIKEKYKRIYMNAVDAFETNDIGLLLLCAYEVEIKVEEPTAKEYIKISSEAYKKRLKEISTIIGYQWYHIPSTNRIHFLENYLKSLGFVFNKDKATNVIRNNRMKRRKPGTRPENIFVNRKKRK